MGAAGEPSAAEKEFECDYGEVSGGRCAYPKENLSPALQEGFLTPKLYDICHVLNYNTYYDLNLYEVGTYKCPPLYSYGPVVRNHYIVHYVYSGKGILTLDKQNYPVGSREIFVMPPNVTTFYQADEHDPWNYIWLHFDGAKAVEYLRKIGIKRHRPVMHPIREDNKISYYMEQILQHSTEEALCIGMLYSFFHELIMNTPNRQSPDHRDLHQKYTKAMLDYISLKYNEHIRVRDLANICGLDRSCTTRVFKAATGHSPQEYLMSYRIKMAKSLLKNPQISIQYVANSVGYFDQFAFSKIFKKHTGISPTQYRTLAGEGKEIPDKTGI